MTDEVVQESDAFVHNRNTDKANGEEFAHTFRGRAVWVPGLGWLLYDGVRWVQDDGLARYQLIAALAHGLQALAVVPQTTSRGRPTRSGLGGWSRRWA